MEKKSEQDCGRGDERVIAHRVHTEIKPVGEVVDDLVYVHIRPSRMLVDDVALDPLLLQAVNRKVATVPRPAELYRRRD